MLLLSLGGITMHCLWKCWWKQTYYIASHIEHTSTHNYVEHMAFGD